MKIKTKKQFTLPQLIEWAWKDPKEVESKIFESDNIDYFSNTAHVQFSNDGFGVRMSSSVSVDDTFTVEDEEEIDEDTVIPRLVVRHRDTGFALYENDYINNEFPLDSVQAFYILNDDLTMTLIWRDGKLVE